MKQKKMLALLLSLAMIVTTVLGNGTFVSASATKATTGISYYVDSVNGMTIMTVLVKQKPGSHLKKLMQLLSSRVISLDLKRLLMERSFKSKGFR